MENILPITVISAIVLFIIKEVLEFIKKAKAKARKLQAMKRALKEELELNYWAWKNFESLVKSVKKAEEGSSYVHSVSPSGTERFELTYPNGKGIGQAFPNVVTNLYNKLIIDIAESDAVMYEKFISSYKALSELQHLRNGIVDFIHDSRVGENYVEGFTEYALNELPPIYLKLDEFYQYCTGKKLTEHRMR